MGNHKGHRNGVALRRTRATNIGHYDNPLSKSSPKTHVVSIGWNAWKDLRSPPRIVPMVAMRRNKKQIIFHGWCMTDGLTLWWFEHFALVIAAGSEGLHGNDTDHYDSATFFDDDDDAVDADAYDGTSTARGHDVSYLESNVSPIVRPHRILKPLFSLRSLCIFEHSAQ